MDFTQQQTFCLLYHQHGDAVNAAIGAGIEAKQAAAWAAKALQTSEVKIALEYMRENGTMATGDDVLRELSCILRSNIQDYVDENNAMRNISQLPAYKTRAISSVTVTTKTLWDDDSPNGQETKVELRLWDKIKAADSLGKYHGLWEKDNRQKAANIVVTVAKPAAPSLLEQADAPLLEETDDDWEFK